jgi:hypothetical protein
MYQPLIKVLCLPQEWRLPVLASYHDFLNHATVEKSYYTMREKFFWRNLYADLTNYVQSCPACQLLRCRARKPIRSGTWEIPKPYEVANIDHLGPIKPAYKGYNYILTVSDNHTQYLESIPVKSTSAVETAQNLYEKYYLRHGFVPNLISDRAQSFLANLTQELFKICKIRHIKTSSYHPQLNAAAEVKNKTLNLGLRVHLLQGQTDWPRRVPDITFAFNVSFISSLGTSPFVLTYNRNPRLAVDAQLLQAARESKVPHFAESFLGRFELLHQAVAQNLAENRLAAQQNQFARARQHNLKEGDLVYQTDFSQYDDASNKLKPAWKGPFKILQIIGDHNARLLNILTGKEERNLVNLDHVRTATQRRQILHQYWQETQRQALPSNPPSTSREAEQPTVTANNAPDQLQNERAR